MELKEKINSKINKTIKYVFNLDDGLIIEVTYIDNGSDKDIICVASQTMCAMSCSFCHLTDHVGKIKLRNVDASEINQTVDMIYKDLSLADKNRRLHISYMGCGESLANAKEVERSMLWIKNEFANVTFGLATILPKKHWLDLFKLAHFVKKNDIKLKVHLSLHYTDDETRFKFMPSALDINSSIAALEFYKGITGNDVEVHYTMIKGENDTIQNEVKLGILLFKRNISVKFLRFNSKKSNDNEKSEMGTITKFRESLRTSGIISQYYESPGHDIAASCGEFLLDEYSK